MSNVRPQDKWHVVMRRLLESLVLSSALLLAACTVSTPMPASPEAAVSQRLAHYAELLRRQDSFALSAMFEPAGFMAHQGQPSIVGRSAIQIFLESFASYKVLAYELQLKSSIAQGRTVQQTGTYAQTGLTPEGRTLQVSGTFTAIWQQEQSGQWLIQSMRTAPAGGA